MPKRRSQQEIQDIKLKTAIKFFGENQWNQSQIARELGVDVHWLNKFIRNEMCGKDREYWENKVRNFYILKDYFKGGNKNEKRN